MKNLTKEQKITIVCLLIAVFCIGFLLGGAFIEISWKNTLSAKMVKRDETGTEDTQSAETSITQKKLTEAELAQLKAKIEEDEAGYGDNYHKLTSTIYASYTRKPDRIVYKQGNQDGFYIFEKDDENYEHLLEVSEDRMAYAVMQDFNLYCFTPDSVDTMTTSGDNYIIFDYDNENRTDYVTGFQKSLVFRFSENTRLYRLASYLSAYKGPVSKDGLGKAEFATDTSISGYKYMNDGYLSGN